MNVLPPVIGRILTGIALFLTGMIFIGFGYAVASEGYGIGLMLVGLIAFIFAPIWIWRGGRLGAEIRGDCLVVHHYFHDIVIPLQKPLRVFRGIDATIIETPHRRFVLDDCYFSDSSTCEAMVAALISRADNHIDVREANVA